MSFRASLGCVKITSAIDLARACSPGHRKSFDIGLLLREGLVVMKFRTFNLLPARRKLFVLLIGFAAGLSFLIVSASSAQQPVDSRPRQTGATTATPQPTP